MYAMEQFFECPDCRSLHGEPAEAYYVLHVRCFDCEAESEYREEVALTVRVPVAA